MVVTKEVVRITGVVELVKKSWEAFRENWKGYLWFQLLAGIVVSLPLAVLSGVFFMRHWEGISSLAKAEVVTSKQRIMEILLQLISDPLVFIIIVVMLTLGTVVTLAFGQYVYQRLMGKDKPSIKESYVYGLKNFFPYLLLSIVVGLFILSGFVLLIIPGFIFAVWMAFYRTVFILEGKRGLDALKRSRELVQGYFWPLVGRLAAYFIPVSIVDQMLTELADNTGTLATIGTPLQIIFSLITSIVGVIYLFYIYQDLVEIKK